MKSILGSHPAENTSRHAPVSTPRLVFLVGFMGAGKTSVGKALAHQLGWQFEDLDDRIVEREQRPVEQIFRESGESEFRRAEHQALRALLGETGQVARVVALGGGAFVQPENATLLAQSEAVTVFLDAPVEMLYQRCRQDGQLERPLRKSELEFRELYEIRRPHYMKASARVITESLDVETVAQAVAAALGLQGNQSFRGDGT